MRAEREISPDETPVQERLAPRMNQAGWFAEVNGVVAFPALSSSP
jgi:hypothetical protein